MYNFFRLSPGTHQEPVRLKKSGLGVQKPELIKIVQHFPMPAGALSISKERSDYSPEVTHSQEKDRELLHPIFENE